MVYMITPLSEEELINNEVVPKGRYGFQVIESHNQISKSGNPMNKVLLALYLNNKKQGLVSDYLVFTNAPLNIKKVKHFCDTTGLQNEYKKGEIRENFVMLEGEVDIDIEEAQPKPQGGFYARKNIVVDYLGKKEPLAENDPNDDIPF